MAKIASTQPQKKQEGEIEVVQKQSSKEEFDTFEKQKSAEKEKLELLFSDKSSLFVKRHTLYKELTQVSVSVEMSSSLEVIREFLRTKIKNSASIKQFRTASSTISSFQE